MGTPVNGFEAFVDAILLVHLGEYTNACGDIFGLEREIRIGPIAINKEAFKSFAVKLDKFESKLTAFTPNFNLRQFLGFVAQFAQDFVFNR